MNNKKIFPSQILDFTIDNLHQRHSVKSQTIYICLVVLIVSIILSLPWIKVDIIVKSRGIIRPVAEVTVINSPVDGVIQDIHVKENLSVLMGDTLCQFESLQLSKKKKDALRMKHELMIYMRDVQVLLDSMEKSPYSKVTGLKSSLYQQDFSTFYQQVLRLNTDYVKKRNDFNRVKSLYDAEAVAMTEFENAQFELEKSLSELNNLHQSQLTNWENQHWSYKEEILELESELNQIAEEIKRYVIISPVTGTVQGLTGLFDRSTVFNGQELFKISPDSVLIVETYIHPADIGLIRDRMNVKYQLDAFNYNQWGLATGQVNEVSGDITFQNDDQPVFIVRCSLDQKALKLKNGYQGKLIKGMTLNAQFVVTERSLWQLLHDTIDDWLNPTMN